MEVRANEGRAGEASAHRTCARVLTDDRGVVLSIEPAFTELLGWTQAEMLGRRIGELAHHDDLKKGLAAWAQMLKEQAGAAGPPARIRYRHRDGRWVWTEVRSTNRLDTDGHVVTDLVDVTGEVELRDLLGARSQLLSHLGDVSPVGVFHADGDGSLLYVSRRLEEITKVSGAPTLAEQLAAVSEGDRGAFRSTLQRAAAGSEAVVELDAGERRWRVNVRPVRDADGAVTGVTGCVEDVTPGTGAGATDPLTGCLTLEATIRALDGIVKRHGPAAAARQGGRRKGDGRGTAVIVVDFGDLAELSETHGDTSVEEVLRLEALRIVDTVRASDVVGRTGESAFSVLCGGVPGPTTARTIGRSIFRQVGAPIILRSGGPVAVRPGIGVAWTSDADQAAKDLLAQAQGAAEESRLSDPPEPVLAESRLAALTTAASDASRIDESMPTPHQEEPGAPGDSAST